MRFLVRIILIAGLAYLVSRYLPWWGTAIVGFAVGFLMSQGKKKRLFARKPKPSFSFIAGFLAVALLWGLMAWWMDSQNGSQLSLRIAELLLQQSPPPPSASLQIVGITALIGGLVGGFSTMTGNLLGEAIKSS
ncbi:MAG: hypothetical protein AAFR66_09715 [Bacteroidota bacterium]